MDRLLILSSVICGGISFYFAGPGAGILSFCFGFFSSVLFQKGNEKLRKNGLAEADRKKQADNLDFVFFSFALSLFVFCIAIAVASTLGASL